MYYKFKLQNKIRPFGKLQVTKITKKSSKRGFNFILYLLCMGASFSIYADSSADLQSNKLGFKVQGISYSEDLGNIKTSIPQEFNADLTLSDFKVFDEDGKVENSDNSSEKIISYKWYDANNTNITDLTKTVGCSDLSMPLTLKIALEYAQPQNNKAALHKDYKITTNSAICFAKPNSADVISNRQWYGFDSDGNRQGWNAKKFTTPHPINGGGYSSDYVPYKGFKAGALTKFPTTGFAGAKFQLIMTGSQADYVYTSIATPSDSVTVDSDGFVTLKSKPQGDVTIRASLKSDESIFHDYVFNPTGLWVVPKQLHAQYRLAKSICGENAKMLSRAELTNSPQKDAPSDSPIPPNYYTRAIDGSVFGEWGYTTITTYPGSQWVDGWYWAQDLDSPSIPFVVGSDDGHVDWYYGVNNSNFIVCRG
ncbi:hypothetical protein RCS94_02580 [Orbaceae bacterium ac157xtp]